MGKLRSPKVEASGSGSSASAAPVNADYLVGTANATLTNEIVVGTTPGGELGGTWASPTIDATHSGSAHSAFLPLAGGTMTGTIAVTNNADITFADNGPSGSIISWPVANLYEAGGGAGLKTDSPFFSVGDISARSGAATLVLMGAVGPGSEAGITFGASTPANWYRSAAATIKTDSDLVVVGSIKQSTTKVVLDTDHTAAADPHTGYVLESLLDAKGDIIAASADNTPAKVTVGSNGQVLTADSAQSAGVKWATASSGTTSFVSIKKWGP